MTRRTSLTWLGPASLGGLLTLAACSADSGQTGSPVSEPPPVRPPSYQSPGRKEPDRPGGGTGEGPNTGGGGSGRPDAVPRPAPKPGTTALLGETLVIADRGQLVLVDV